MARGDGFFERPYRGTQPEPDPKWLRRTHAETTNGAGNEKGRRPKATTCNFVEPMSGLEPLTYALRVRCSTN